MLKPELYEKIAEEVKALEPTLKLLNLGKGSQAQRDTGSFRAVKKQKTGPTETAASPEEMATAAKHFHAWLKLEKSAFRSFLFIVSGSNTYILHRSHRRDATLDDFNPALPYKDPKLWEVMVYIYIYIICI